MKHARIAAIPALMFALVAEGTAQVPVLLGPTRGIGFSFARGSLAGGFYFGGYGLSYGTPLFWAPPYPYYAMTRVTQVTIVSPPPLLEPRPLVLAPQINVNVHLPQRHDELRDEDFPDKIIIRPGQKTKVPAADAAPAMPGQRAGQFRPLRPEDRERIAQPAPPVQPEAPAVPQGPLPPWIPDQPPPQVPQPQAPPAERSLALGKLAFANQEYARAERRFRQAVDEDPRHALAWFYLAQARFAGGKYQEAVAAIQTGLQLRPTWPTSRFRAREPYVLNGADFVEHLQLLEQALLRHPEDPVLLFLYAYQLWFDGREERARMIFRQAEPLVADPRFIRLFLQAQPDGPVVQR